MSIRKVILTIVLAFVAVAASAAPVQKTSQQASRSGELRVYTAFLENEALEIFKRFEAETGVKVKYVRLGAGEILTRLRAEAQRPQASIWFGGASDAFHAATTAGLLEPYVSPASAAVNPAYLDSKGVWSPATLGVISFATNTRWLAENKLTPPTSWQDPLLPAFAQNVATAHPATSGTAATLLATIVQLMGEDAGFAYFGQLNKNILQYTKSGAAPLRMSGLGEVGMAVAFSQDIQQAIAEGLPVAISFPREGTGFEVSAMAIIKNGPADELENAKAFIDWALGKSAQEMFGRFYRIPVNPEAAVPAGSVRLADVKTINYDAVWFGQNRDRLLQRFDAEITSRQKAR